MKLKIIFQKDKYIVGITEDGKLFESYGNTYTRNILGAAGLYIQELQAEIAKLKGKRRLKMRNIQFLKDLYPTGTRVKLVEMNDIQAPPIGTLGTVMYVDDIGTIHIKSVLDNLEWRVIYFIPHAEMRTPEGLCHYLPYRDTKAPNAKKEFDKDIDRLKKYISELL